MKLTNEITDRCIHYFGDIVHAEDRKPMRAIITKQNRMEREAMYESKRAEKETQKILKENWEQLEKNYQPKH